MANLVQLYLDKDSGRLVARGGPGGGGGPPVPPGLYRVFGYVFRQPVAVGTWTIAHGGETSDVTIDIFDADGEVILPNQAYVVDENTVEITFTTPQNGQANLLLFSVP